jgi:UDPglucose--hexose-1-phosphate uridylyltransferase
MSFKIPFRIAESESAFLDPRKNFEPTAERFQVRFDPLTGRSGHFSHFGAIKPQVLPLERYSTQAIKGFCPFCLENREKVTPKFVAEIVPERRLQKNQAFLVPNLFPYDVYSGVMIMTDEHVVPLEGVYGRDVDGRPLSGHSIPEKG